MSPPVIQNSTAEPPKKERNAERRETEKTQSISFPAAEPVEVLRLIRCCQYLTGRRNAITYNLYVTG
jgi:hypothetical protein